MVIELVELELHTNTRCYPFLLKIYGVSMKKNRVYRFHEDLEIALARFSGKLFIFMEKLINHVLTRVFQIAIKIHFFLDTQ